MTEDRSSYRQVIKATSIFGGVQAFQILISIIRSKFIAILLGPYGMGISGLLQSGTEMVTAISNFGISTSAVKYISERNVGENLQELNSITTLIRRLVWCTGFIGLVITLVASPYLSQIIFGNKDFTWSFVLLSVTLLINQISEGYGIMLRGLREVKFLAKSSFIGSFLGLLSSLPLYYFLGIEGIVPALILAALTSLTLNWYFAMRLPIKSVEISFKYVIETGKKIIYLGLMLSLTGIITIASSNIVKIFISNFGSVNDVGFYNAGFAIINTYVGMIFTAMSIDYFPRLSGVANNVVLANKTVNQQAEISLLILSPFILFFIIFSKWIIYALYSESFSPIQEMILFAALGTLFKALSWSFAFLILAKGSNKVFLFNELIANAYFLPINIFGYYVYGLKGLGFAYLFSYLFYTIQTFWVLKFKFDFFISKSLIHIFFVQLFLSSLSLVLMYYKDFEFSFFYCILLLLASISFSFLGLYKRFFDLGKFSK